jgi:hypothetical protein
MKELHIIESETPGLTRTKITVTRERSVKGRSGDVIFTVPDFAEMAKEFLEYIEVPGKQIHIL